MSKKKKQRKPGEMPQPRKTPEISPKSDPEYPSLPREKPGLVPQEEPFPPGPEEVPPQEDFWDDEFLMSRYFKSI